MKKFLAEFKEFAIKGNMFDLAVGVIIGAAFNTIVKSLVDDVIMPAVGMLIGGHDFTKLVLQFGTATIKYGNLIQNIVNFLITAFCLFVVVKSINTLKRRKEAAEAAVEQAPPAKPDDIALLEEIRDTLAEIKNK
ncbi:MAG: large-conductance mechanosensitive channel protein MscL [Clostridia bacterium]|nr:large-conductance mechanosensitive channel protein MscL [Clostridia bacterium]